MNIISGGKKWGLRSQREPLRACVQYYAFLVQTVFPPWLHNIGKRCYLGIKYREKEREEDQKERENNVIET